MRKKQGPIIKGFWLWLIFGCLLARWAWADISVNLDVPHTQISPDEGLVYQLHVKTTEDENVDEDKGILGTFESDKLVVPQFKEVVQDLNVGETSEPFKTEYGYHIVKLIERQDKRRFTLENDWQQIEQFALNYKMEQEYKKWIQELKKNVAIEMRDLS